MRRLLFALLLWPCLGRAVVVVNTPVADTMMAPADDFGFVNVAKVFDTADGFYTSGVYLGNGWMISAYHPVRDRFNPGGFSFGEVLLAGGSYAVDGNSAVRITNADGMPTDLAVFRLTQTPPLPSVSISAATPNTTAAVTMAGNGIGGAATETRWNVDTSTNPDTWTETTSILPDQRGYYLSAPQAVRWGTNRLESFGLGVFTSSGDSGYGDVTYIRTNFSANRTGEAQGTDGDSGGGLFYKNGAQWELLGIMFSTSRFDGQPSTVFPSAIQQPSAVFGNETFAVNLPTYRAQILAIIPEPGAGALLACGAWLMVSRRRRVWRANEGARVVEE